MATTVVEGAPVETSGALGFGRHERVVRRRSQPLDAATHMEVGSSAPPAAIDLDNVVGY